MPREEIVGPHLFAIGAEHRRSEQTPFYLSHNLKLVTHVQWIRVGDDFLDRRRPHGAELEWM